ncbi:uncharacterized protein Z519_09157 [Cladophialophora bantiana CBS 173.52]|uniref:NmrA-like domain-containing protein n=1 Tax=Cladophialophora bantiana (strain ATCC 10958 / CBS 173.52 / CDC B-1940 / NIH 8579) TaxID=1442370 RepID=A0A0D2HIG3_CLAB1|nr:uncharacterized protein Z519_09157 [Cladophialophora bantiana CBS 173.52]KIW90510.1 hypothetical protein Z519_09157 [Cladophialophora bantiana CBS 173.52]
MAEIVVLTCASGKQCTQIIPSLYEQPQKYRLRLVVHSQKSFEKLEKQYPGAEVLQADLNVPDDCARLVDGATTIYYVSPTFQPQEQHFAFNVIDAAMAEKAKPNSKFSHFILSSVLHPEISKLLNHDRKRLIEEYLCESSLCYTILQPSHFADNAISRLMAEKDCQAPVFMAAHDPEVAFSFSCVRDHAEASVKIIQERSRHFFATYQLVSTWPMKYTQYVQSIGDVLGKTFEIKRVPYEQAVQKYCELLFGPDQVLDQSQRDAPERLLLYYNSRGIVGNPGVLEWLLGRPATSPAQLASMMVEKGKSTSN